METEKTGLERLIACVEEYDKALEKVAARRKPGDGILGFGNDPKRAPCHMEFYEAMGEAVAAALAEEADAEAMTRFLLELAQSKGHYQMAYPMLEAVQGHALPLVPRLEPAKARELAYWYGRQYPRVRRLPVQQKLYVALEKRGRQKE